VIGQVVRHQALTRKEGEKGKMASRTIKARFLPMSIGFLKIDCFDLLAVQGTFRSLLQHHSSKASTLWHSAFFKVQLSKPYMITG